MFDKQMEKKLQEALGQIDSSKLAEMKKKLESSEDLNAMLSRLDVQKAEQKLKELNLGETTSAAGLTDIINTLKKNPDIIRQLKKNL